MASIRKRILIDAKVEDVWDAIRDWQSPHERLVRGFVTGSRPDGDDRIVTFFNGAEVREVLIDLDKDARRLVWSVVDGPYTHHNGVAQAEDAGEGRTHFTWVADLLPNEAAAPTSEMMDQGIAAVKQTLESN
jgi:hypothetical protein